MDHTSDKGQGNKKKMEKITFYSITPLFRFGLDPDTSVFSHADTYKDAEYKIKIVEPEQGPNFFDILMPWADTEIRKYCKQIHLPPRMLGEPAKFFLTIDVTYKYTEELKISGNTAESVKIRSAVLDALRLVSSKGLLYYRDYNFSSILSSTRGSGAPLIDQYLFSHLGHEPSILDESNFATCQSVFKTLLHKQHNSDEGPDTLLELALAYHQIVFKLEKVQHSFLILMIIFESLFKNIGENNIANSSRRIGDELGNTSAEENAIKREFDDNADNTFGKLRNDIAHGDSSLDIQIIKDKYPVLYGYITRAIIKYVENIKE